MTPLLGRYHRSAARFALLAWLALASGLAWGSETAGRALKSPFSTAPSLPSPAAIATPCREPFEAVRDIQIATAYVPGDYTRVDPDRMEARRAATAPLHAYLGMVTRLSDEAMRSTGEARARKQACVERWLAAWAEKDAMLGTVSWPEGAYERKWILAGLSLAYLKTYGADLPARPPATTERWFRRLAEQIVGEYSGLAWKRNNHFYWAGLAAAAAATVIDDRAIYAWGQTQYDMGMAAVRDDGALPLELARGPLALYYHAFSAAPLSALLAFRSANRDVRHDAPLRRLVGLILRGLAEPQVFTRLTGGAQQNWMQGGPSGRTLAWLEFYRAVTDDSAPDAWIASYRPLGTIWLGGDLTLAIGRPLPEAAKMRSPLSVP